jgi:hypothetical protein
VQAKGSDDPRRGEQRKNQKGDLIGSDQGEAAVKRLLQDHPAECGASCGPSKAAHTVEASGHAHLLISYVPEGGPVQRRQD